MRSVIARFSSDPTVVTCFDPIGAYVNWHPWASVICVWSLFTISFEGTFSVLTLYAIRRNALKRITSESAGIFPPAHVERRIVHPIERLRNFFTKSSEHRNRVPSWEGCLKMRGAENSSWPIMMPRMVIKVSGIEQLRRSVSVLMIFSVAVGYLMRTPTWVLAPPGRCPLSTLSRVCWLQRGLSPDRSIQPPSVCGASFARKGWDRISSGHEQYLKVTFQACFDEHVYRSVPRVEEPSSSQERQICIPLHVVVQELLAVAGHVRLQPGVV